MSVGLDVPNPELPLVSAIMLTGRMPQWQVQLAVNCFANQTYPNKELIIINNAESQLQASALDLVLPVLEGRAIAHIVDTEQLMSAGMCRNYGISAASGNILVQFDAHCWHSPYRIAEQLESLSKHESHMCMLTHALEYSYGSGLATYWSNRKRFLPNTMMTMRPKDDDYADVDKAEELSLLGKLIKSGYRPIALERPQLVCRMHYSAHQQIKRVRPFPGDPPSAQHLRLVRATVRAQALG